MTTTPRPCRLFFMVIVLTLLLFSACDQASHTRDPQLRLAVFADNQVGYGIWQATMAVNPSSANIPQLTQNIMDIVAARAR